MEVLGLVVSEKKIFLCFSHCKSMEANDPRGGTVFEPRGMVCRIYKEDHYTLLHTKYESSGPCGSEKKIFFLCFSHCKSMEANDPRGGAIFNPGAWLAGFIKRTTTHCYIQNMKALGLVVSEKKIFLCFSHDAPGAGAVGTPGARLAGFTKHCYTQNMKAQGLVVSEKIFLCFPIVSIWEFSFAMETRVLIRPGPKPNTTVKCLNDSELFYATLLEQVYSYQNEGRLFICGDFNSRVGDASEYIEGVDDVMSRDVIDYTVNNNGDLLIDFMVDSGLCMVNGRVGHNNFTHVSHRGKSVVDYVCVPYEQMCFVSDFHVHLMSDLVGVLNYQGVTKVPDHSVLTWSSKGFVK